MVRLSGLDKNNTDCSQLWYTKEEWRQDITGLSDFEVIATMSSTMLKFPQYRMYFARTHIYWYTSVLMFNYDIS